jgi:hypothetical protein
VLFVERNPRWEVISAMRIMSPSVDSILMSIK